MKFLTIIALSLFTAGAFAGHDKDHKEMEAKFDKMSFEDAKKMMQEKMEMKSKMIEEGKSCVNDAKDKEALKACKKKMWEGHKQMHEKMHGKMKK